MIEKPVLVVVDMQQYFYDMAMTYTHAYPDQFDKEWYNIVENILFEIEKAKKRDELILVLEFLLKNKDADGSTDRDIYNALYGYSLGHFIEKESNDGSTNIVFTLDNHDDLKSYKPSCFRLTGVNRCYCVAETGFGLRYDFGLNVDFLDYAIGCQQGLKTYLKADLAHYSQSRKLIKKRFLPKEVGLVLKRESK